MVHLGAIPKSESPQYERWDMHVIHATARVLHADFFLNTPVD